MKKEIKTIIILNENNNIIYEFSTLIKLPAKEKNKELIQSLEDFLFKHNEKCIDIINKYEMFPPRFENSILYYKIKNLKKF